MNDLHKIEKCKTYFESELNQGRILSWDQFYEKLSAYELSSELISQLHNWYLSLKSPEFLSNLPFDTQEVFIHNGEFCYVRRMHSATEIGHDYTPRDLNLILNIICLNEEQSWNLKSPFCSFNFQFNNQIFRVTLIHQSLDPEGNHKAFFRVLKKIPLELSNYNYHEQLKAIFHDKKNIIVAGATGSGKTTLLNSLITQTPQHEHIVIIEDTYELISPNKRTSRLLSGSENLDTLLSYSLRMSPDRIILGEIRSNEILTFLLALNTGHQGTISSIHANNANDALHRLALLYATYVDSKMSYQQILKMICTNIDYVIYVNNKQITEIIEVYGSEDQNIFYDSVVA